MKTRKRLLNSTLILALAFGQTSGTIVEAVSVLNTVSSSTTKKETEKKEETTSKTSKKATQSTKEEKKEEVKKDTETSTIQGRSLVPSARVSEENPTFTLAKPIPDDIGVPSSDLDRKVGDHIISYIRNKFNDIIHSTTDNYEVGNKIIYQLESVIANYKNKTPAGFWDKWDFAGATPNWLGLLRKESAGTGKDIYYVTATSESGNWQIHISPPDSAADALNNVTKENLYVTFTRLKVAPSQKEIFKIPKFLCFYYGDGTHFQTRAMYLPLEIVTEFQHAQNAIGRIMVNVKSGDHTLGEHQSTIPNPEEYVTAENTRGKVTYEWITKPDTSKVGKQDVKVSVKDETGRSEEVTFPITVKELLSIKKATDEIYQYDAVPDVKNYFDVTTEGTYTLQWANNPSTSTPVTYTWQATVNTSDGRTETKAMTMKILPYPDLLVKLKPVEDRTFTLGDSSDLLADHFKDYIDEVRMNGEKVDLNDLQLVAEESTKTIFQAIGQQELKLTVQAKHPVSNVMIKGTGTTTVNVNWGNTILVRTADGKSSAGAFTLRVGNTNNTTPTLSLYQGIASPLNEGVGDLTKPYDLYYNFEVLRNGRSVYNQDVTNRATLQEIMDRFGNANNTIDVQMDDIIKIYYPQKLANGSVVMVNEQEKDYTYGSEYAYYKVTPYGFDPAPVMEAESASKDFVLGEDSSQINPKDLVKNVTINGAVADDAFYTVENLSDFDTKTVGRRTMKVKITTNDGLASKEVEVSYNVKWGSTFVVKGLNDATAGAFSLLKNKDQWQLQASQGVEGTDLDNPVDNNFGYDTYYSIEVLRASTSQFLYEVAGNQSIRESINGFNNGQPLNVNKGDVIKVYHADPVGKNLFMENELIKDYTIGSNYAYYEVTDRGLEAILAIQAESSPQEFVLGEDSSDIDGTKLVKSIMINGTPVASDQYTVTQMSEFDTSIAGEKNIRVRIDTKDKMVSKEIEVPYTVKWGESFLVKSKSGGSAGAFSLIDGKALAGTTSSSKVLKISAGLDTPLDEKINADNEPNTYYSIEITRNGSSIYSQNMPGRATLQQIMNNFGNGSNLVTVQTGDIITVNQPQKIEGSSVLWQDETEKDYTYGSNTARYQVTDYGLEPAPELGGTTANKQLNLTEQPENVELNQLLSAVTVNGHAVTDDLYTIKQLTDFDTKTIGKREVKLQIDLKDGYATKEVDIPYEVKWGDSLVMKGLNGATVGVYSFIKKNDQWYLSATQGDPDADLNNWVNNEFGRNDYYRIEVDEGENSLPVPSQPEVFEDSSVNTGNFVYSVTGNMTFGQAIARFNNGQPLPISTGAIIKVYHAEPSKNNLFIQDDVVRDYTAGLNYAYYRVTDSGIEPITDMKANFVKMSLTLGEDATAKDIKALIQNVKFNDQELNTDLYTVEPVDTFDTSTVGEKELKVKLTTSDEVTTKEVAVPYTVNWGNTLVMKNKDGDTISAFSLTKEDKKLQIASLPGKNKSNLSKRITNADDSDVYYSIEVFSHNASQYKYEVHGKQTIEQAISRFNGGEPLTVSAGDQVKVYHADPSGNVFMSDEQEGNYTYGSNYAYYNVTDYGFEPTGDLSVTPAEPNITVGTKEVDLKDLLKEVKVNDKAVPKNSYTVTLDPETEMDTSSVGTRTAKLVVKVDRAYGAFSTTTEATYHVVEEGAAGDNATGGDQEGNADNDGANADGSADGSLPKTNETKNATFSILGAFLVSVAGMTLFWKRRKTNEEKK